MIRTRFYKGNQLFPDYQMMMRRTTSQREFEEVFSQDIDVFADIFEKSLEMMKLESKSRPPHFRNRNWYAETMNSNIQGLLIEHYGGLMIKENGRYLLYKDGQKILFKKFDRNKIMPSHNETFNSKTLVENVSITGSERDPIIWVGYVVNSTWNHIQGMYAQSIVGTDRNWITDISNRGDDILENTINIANSPDRDPVTKPLVTLKRTINKAE